MSHTDYDPDIEPTASPEGRRPAQTPRPDDEVAAEIREPAVDPEAAPPTPPLPHRSRRDFELSDSMGMPLLARDPAPLSSLLGLPTLIRSRRRRADDLADDESSVSVSRLFGLPLLTEDPSPLSSALKAPTLAPRDETVVVLSHKKASDYTLSAKAGMPLLVDDPAPLSRILHIPTLLHRKPRVERLSDGRSGSVGASNTVTNPPIARRTLSEVLGLPLLIDDPAPLSSALDIPTLVDEPAAPARFRTVEPREGESREDRLWSKPAKNFTLTGREIAALVIGAAMILLPLAGAHH